MSTTLRPESDTVIVTGGAGFIGSAVVRELLASTECRVVNVDCLTYAGNLENLRDVEDRDGYQFVRGDVSIEADVAAALEACPSDGPSQVYVARCEAHLVEPPPPDWDFVVRRTEK